MSFSFRNIFSPDEENIESAATGWQLPAASAPAKAGRGNPDHAKSGTTDSGRYVQSFLVSELIAYIPTAISAQSGIPMQKEVAIPMPGDGSRDVKLSTLYRVCPELFAAEITPLNDSVITLPPKLGGMTSGASPGLGFSSGAAWPMEAAPADNPFWAPGQKGEEGGAPSKRSDMKDEKPKSLQEDVSQWAKGPIGGEVPLFSKAVPQQSPPREITHSPAGPGAFPAGCGEAVGFGISESPATGGVAASGGFFDGLSAFQGTPAPGGADAGESAMQLPKNGGFDKEVPSFKGNPFESDQGFATLFSKQAAEDSDLPFPTGSVPENLNAEPQGVWGAMFHGEGMTPDEQGIKKEVAPFSPPSFENIGNLLKQGSKGADQPAASNVNALPNASTPPAYTPMTAPTNMSPANEFSAFQAAAPAVRVSSPPPETKGVQVSWTAEPKIKPELSPLPQAGQGGAGYSSFGQAPVVAGNGAEASPPASGVSGDLNGIARGQEHRTAESVPVRPAAIAMGESGADRDLELRAIFSLSEVFTLSMVARCVVDLPGIISCSLTTPGKLVQASRSEEGKLGSEAREMISTIRNLAKLTGLPEARTFTLHTDRGIVSLFLEGDYCVTVHHDKATFQPGVREKLIIAARSLAKLGE